MLLSKLLQFIVLLASLISSISQGAAGENVYTVTPTTNLSPNLQYINTSQLRHKNAKSTAADGQSSSAYLSSEAFRDQAAASSSGAPIAPLERKATVREDRFDGGGPKEALKQLLDRRLIKSAHHRAQPNRTRTIDRLVGGFMQYQSSSRYSATPPPSTGEDSSKTKSPTSSLRWTTTTTITPLDEEALDTTHSSTIQNTVATTVIAAASSTEDEWSVEQGTTTTAVPQPPTATRTGQPKTSIIPARRPSYYDIVRENHSSKNINEPLIKSTSSSSTAAPPPPRTNGPPKKNYIRPELVTGGSKLNTKVYFKRKNETSITNNIANLGVEPITTATDDDELVVAAKVSEMPALAPPPPPPKTATNGQLISSNSLSGSSVNRIKTMTTTDRPPPPTQHQQPQSTNLANEIANEGEEEEEDTDGRPSKVHYLTDSLEDAALLEIDQQLDNWDNGLLRASAGAGLESGSAAAGAASAGKPESKKTLSDQVAEGKYGLIQTELFEKPVQRPGVLSYEKNPETPTDTKQSLGGLQDEEIWLAEDHLLVLKGGALLSSDKQSDWVPIDAYEAPKRPVKIPANPEVPPPFPVQLDENGPIQFIGNNQAPFFGAPPNGPLPPPYGGAGAGGGGGGAPGFNPPNLSPWPGAVQNFTTDNGYNYPPPPLPPWIGNASNETFPNPFLNYGPPPPGYPAPPPGFGPPPPFVNGSLENANNTLDYPDEDDPSLYYPPPYSFVYKSNYSNAVAPGPLVPGIVLPPPPNFFTRLEGSTGGTQNSHPHANRTAIRKRPPQRVPIVRPHKQPPAGGDGDSPVTKITKLTTTNIPPTIRRPTTSTPPTTTRHPTIVTTPTTQRTQSPTRNQYQQQHKQLASIPLQKHKNVYIPKYQDQENIVINYESPQQPQFHQPQRPKAVVVPEYQDHYQNTVEPPPPQAQVVTQLKKVNDPLIRFIGSKLNQPPPQPHSNPIYFEYFDAQKGQQLQQQPKRPSTPGPTYIPVTRDPSSTTAAGYDYDKYLYVTPQPEIRPNGAPPAELHIQTQPDIIYQRLPVDPLQSFDHEVETIRQTLNYYQAQPQLIPLTNGAASAGGGEGELDNYQSQVPRTPKAKPVYQYSFDVTEGNHNGLASTSARPNKFLQSTQLDTTPFKPMVQYSAPLGSQADRDGFKPFGQISYFHSTTTPISVPAATASAKPTKHRSKLLPVAVGQQQQQQPQGLRQQINLSGEHLYNVQFGPVETSQQLKSQSLRAGGYLRNVKPGPSYSAYYYDPPSGAAQQQQQQQHHTAVDPYMQQIAALRQKLRHHSTFQEYYQHPSFNHFNGSSALRYYPGEELWRSHPLPRPNSRFTDNQNYNYREQNQQQPSQYQNLLTQSSPPNTQYYSRIQTHPSAHPQSQQQQQPFISLEKDVLVNYKYPLPAGNPDSENLPQEFLDEHRQSSGKRPPPPPFYAPPHLQYNSNQQQYIQYRLPGDQAHVYFLTPQDKRKRTAKAIEEEQEAVADVPKRRRRR